jgi:hypothetical protein
VILGLYAEKSHNLIGLGIFHGDLDFFDLLAKSLDLSNYEIFPHKILKSRTFKKSSILIVISVICHLKYIYVLRQFTNLRGHILWIPPPPLQENYESVQLPDLELPEKERVKKPWYVIMKVILCEDKKITLISNKMLWMSNPPPRKRYVCQVHMLENLQKSAPIINLLLFLIQTSVISLLYILFFINVVACSSLWLHF